jgi:hypothetical protein
MLERKMDLAPGVDGLRARGHLTRDDVDRVLAPMLEEARQKGQRLRLLFECDDDYRGVAADAVWEDLRLVVHHLRRIERCAVVSDVDWIRTVVRIKALMSGPFRCEIRVFHEAEKVEALAWLTSPSERPPMPHRLIPEKGILVIEPQGALRREDFEAVAATVDPYLEEHGTLDGVVVRTRDFPGWKDAAGLFSHMRFVRDHHHTIRRVALVSDDRLVELAERLAEHFIAAEVRRFAYDQLDAALRWAAGATEPASAIARQARA